MSRIYFHTPTAEAELRGSERAYMGGLTSDALIGGLGLHEGRFFFEEAAERIRKLYVSSDQYPPTMPRDFVTRLRVPGTFGEESFRVGGDSINVFSCSLNTLLATGSDPMKLAARLHGQCEIHAYVEGPNRAWLADIMEIGRRSGIFRDNQGWEEVTDLLRSRDDEPVVTSYSVCDQFPNSHVAEDAGTWSPSKDYDGEPHDAWYDLDPYIQWDVALKAIRKVEYGCELRPDNWDFPKFYFGDVPLTAFNVAEAAYEMEKA